MAAKLKIEKRGDEIKKKSSPLKLLSQSERKFAEMILGWSPSKIVSGISDLRPRWPPQPNLISHRTLWEIPIKKPFAQQELNFDEIVIGWFFSKHLTGGSAL
jgi:hypothetical protein